MAPDVEPPPEVDRGEPPAAGAFGPHRWTFGRIATDLAIVMVAVPSGLDALSPPTRGGCGMTAESSAFSIGLAILGLRACWIVLKTLNDAVERRLAAPSGPTKPKPIPLDDPWTP